MASLLSKPKIPGKSADQVAAEKYRSEEIKRLKKEENQRKAALSRSQTGRASLIATSERGVPKDETLG